MLRLFLAAVLAAVLAGCSAPAAIRQAQEAADRSIATYARNTGEIARQAAAAYRAEALAHARYRARMSLDACTTPAGGVPRETVEAVLLELRRIEAEIDAETGKIEQAMAAARLDLEDSAAFRAEVGAYLATDGVSAATAGAIADQIQARMEARKP